jgi:hypothetical protein
MNAAWCAYRILANPSGEWTMIESEAGDAAYLLSGYVAPLALVPAVSGFIGACIIGVAVPGTGTVHAPIFDGLFGAVFGYVMSCATVLILGLLIDLLAPAFGGRRNFDTAFKLAVYAYTPVWLVGIFLLAPGLHFLGLLGLYGAYLLWLGLPRLMKTPEQKSQTFAVVIVVCACALFFIAATAQRALFDPAGFWL